MKSSNFVYDFFLRYVCYVFLILCSSRTVQSVEIECIPLKSCPLLLKMLTTRKHSPDMTEFLKYSHCGYDDLRQPKVWCTKLDFCQTPDNENGTCTPMQECKPFLKLANTLDTLDYRNQNYLDQFRCDEILEEIHVCCPTEPSPNLSGKASISTKAPSFYDTPETPMKNRFDYEEYDYEYTDLMADEPEPYDNYHRHSFKGDFHTGHHMHDENYHMHKHNHRNMGFGRGENSNSHHGEDNDFYKHGDSGRDDISTNDGSGKDNLPSNNKRGASEYDDTSHETTEREQDGRTTSTRKPTTRRSKSSTPKSKGYTTPRDADAIIFVDSLEDFTTEKSRPTTKQTTTVRSQTKNVNKSCETPDRKPGVCTKEHDCQRYLKLKDNLDKSKKTVRDYLSNFKCNSTSTRDTFICCQKDEEIDIDNSVFNNERTNENVPEPYSKICGRQTANSDKIFGGSVADLGEFPWMALLNYPSNQGLQFGCGGALISNRHVLTAAHCVDENILKRRELGKLRQVVLGEYDVRNKTDCIYMDLGVDCADSPKTIGVDSIVTHNSYNSNTTKHDIAIIKLNQEVKFTDYIKPICLPTKSSTINGNETFVIAGWGRTPTEPSSPILRKARIPYVPKENCNARTPSGGTLIEGQVCAGFGNGTDSCNGDSGGPLMLDVNFNFEFVTHIVGIISYGFGECGSAASVNTYVPYYVDWIKENMT